MAESTAPFFTPRPPICSRTILSRAIRVVSPADTPASPPAAAAQSAFRLHVDVTDFHARAGAAPKELALINQSAADASAGKHSEQTTHALAGAEAVFAIGARVHVVGDHDRASEILDEFLF